MCWQRRPLFFGALYFLLGASVALYPHWIYAIPFLTFFYQKNSRLKLLKYPFLIGIILLVCGYSYTLFHYPSFNYVEEKMEGEGVFVLETIQPSHSPFQRAFVLKGVMQYFTSEGNSYRNIPCVIFRKGPPHSGTKWLLKGSLEKKGLFQFSFKPNKEAPWQEMEASFWIQKRFASKEKVRQFFHTTTKDKEVAHFFASMATGDIDDRLLAMEFRKLGLGHILAISGFHFALLATLIGTVLRLALPPQFACIVLFGALMSYFIFLGISPSVFRAFIMIALFLIGQLLNRRIDSLNILGAALFIELIYDPLVLTQVSFQLSFLATLGILLFHRSCSKYLTPLLPQRSPTEIQHLQTLHRYGQIFSKMIREALALNISVQLTTLPVSLYIFHCFPLLSLPYNILLTPFLGISLLLLPLGILLPPLAFLNRHYTSWLLNLIGNPPEILNYKIYIYNFPFPLLLSLLTFIGIWGLTKRDKNSRIID